MKQRRPNPAFRRAAGAWGRTNLGALGQALDYPTLQQLASNAGFSGSDVNVAAAIALAETGGNPGDYNPETQAKGGTPAGQGSYGLWQIYLRDHPQFNGQNLYDPQTNANAAYQVFLQQGFSAWTTFNSGRYLAFLYGAPSPAAAPGAAAPPLTIDASTGQPILDTTPTPANPVGALTQGQMLVLTAVAAGLYFLADSLAD